MGPDAIRKALQQLSCSPFSNYIQDAELPCRFTQPTFITYNGKTNPMEHVGHFNQRMTIHSQNKALICKMYPSSLGPTAMRWFNDLEEGSIRMFEELTRAFRARFITCYRVPPPIDSLLSMEMKKGESLRA